MKKNYYFCSTGQASSDILKCVKLYDNHEGKSFKTRLRSRFFSQMEMFLFFFFLNEVWRMSWGKYVLVWGRTLMKQVKLLKILCFAFGSNLHEQTYFTLLMILY